MTATQIRLAPLDALPVQRRQVELIPECGVRCGVVVHCLVDDIPVLRAG